MGGHFDIATKLTRIEELNDLINQEGFWNTQNDSVKITQELSNLKELVNQYQKLESDLDFCLDNFEIIKDDLEEITNIIKNANKTIESLENELYFNGEYDKLNCYLEIHPGAGGTEAQDWASMLLNMYERFCEKNNFAFEEISISKGDEAGIKSAIIIIKGINAYAYLKNESGVHRLVRISPFDAGRRRHTSFAAVTITPEFKSTPNIEINETDLKIDVYHSSGAGGQSVNTTNSAVRITHLPTKIVVTCQNERSQLKNKETALKILMNKLYESELKKNEEKINSLKNNDININFGSQIRSYVLEPYKLVKDNRSNYENNDPDKILNGDILEMLEYNLKKI